MTARSTARRRGGRVRERATPYTLASGPIVVDASMAAVWFTSEPDPRGAARLLEPGGGAGIPVERRSHLKRIGRRVFRMMVVGDSFDNRMGQAPQSQQVRSNLRMRHTENFALDLMQGPAFPGCFKQRRKPFGNARRGQTASPETRTLVNQTSFAILFIARRIDSKL